ncbi:MAG: GspE/PulE family protein [Nitrospirae bacterium]|nr:GspE/PulE family protein [Nitrospirota bacterium]
MQRKKQHIGEYLIRKKIITKEQLEIALLEQHSQPRNKKEKTGEIFVRWGFASYKQILEALIEIEPAALIDEDGYGHSIPNHVLINTQSVVIGGDGKHIYIGTLNTHPHDVVRTLQEHVKDQQVQLAPHGVSPDQIRDKLERLKKDETVHFNNTTDGGDPDIPGIVHSIMSRGLQDGASDIHIINTGHSIHIRYRTDGDLHTKLVFPITIEQQLYARFKDLCHVDMSQKRKAQDGSFSQKYRGRIVDFRVSIIPMINSTEKICIRILDKEKIFIPIEELGITQVSEWLALTNMANGIILVCGPTGSGKTTTLYSTVNRMNKLGKAIFTIEDPVEYEVPFIFQTQVNARDEITFASYLKYVLRQDPDIIISGEIRDEESCDNALAAADTGHLVYATLHTNDAISTLQRLKDFDIDWGKLVFALRGIMVQKLVKKIHLDCKRKGCAACNNTGFKGRTLITEFVRFNGPADIHALREQKLNYHTFQADEVLKLSRRITSGDEIIRVAGRCHKGEWCSDCLTPALCQHLAADGNNSLPQSGSAPVPVPVSVQAQEAANEPIILSPDKDTDTAKDVSQGDAKNDTSTDKATTAKVNDNPVTSSPWKGTFTEGDYI